MDNVTAAALERKFKGEGADRFAKIAELGGFGRVGAESGSLDPASNLDLAGVLDPENKAVTDGDKNKIRELAGVAAEGKAEAPKADKK